MHVPWVHARALFMRQMLTFLCGTALLACGSSGKQAPATDDGPVAQAMPMDGACRAAGRYQAGKEGSYQPCCQGLTEVVWPIPVTNAAGHRECIQPPHREYGCVSGTCGDGVCEPGEAGGCGCAADCTDARLGDPEPTEGFQPEPTEAMPDNALGEPSSNPLDSGAPDTGMPESRLLDAGPLVPAINPHAVDTSLSDRRGCYAGFDDGRDCDAAFLQVAACPDRAAASLLPDNLSFESGPGCYWFCPDVPDCANLDLDHAAELLCQFAEGNSIATSLGLRTLCGPEPTEHGPCCFGIDANQVFN